MRHKTRLPWPRYRPESLKENSFEVRKFPSAMPSRPQGCGGQAISATARPCALDRNAFGFFKPTNSSEAAESVDISACTEPDTLLMLLYRVRKRVVEVLSAARAELQPGVEATDADGRRGVIVRVNSRSAYLVDDDGEWRVAVGSVRLADQLGGS